MKNAAAHLAALLGVRPALLEGLDHRLREVTGRPGTLARVWEESEARRAAALKLLGVSENCRAADVRAALLERVAVHERRLAAYLKTQIGRNDFERAAHLAEAAAKIGKGFFLRKEYARAILKKAAPEHLLKYRGARTMEEFLAKEDIFSAFSALRFTESDEWMHRTFERFYSNFLPVDFEERKIEIKVLGPEWREVAEKFVAKKRHNVSHLKEFGVIFINPIKENISGKFLRDFALLLHYFHEIEFYARMFRRYAAGKDFAERLKSLLRGDVLDQKTVKEGEWLIVQRYLSKEDPSDARLFLPRVNPESLHWGRGERDLAEFFKKEGEKGIFFWNDLDWVGGLFPGPSGQELVSFDLEDNAMSLVSKSEGRNENFTYHQREALWTKIFKEYVGGEEAMEKLLVENFEKGIITFSN